MKQVRRRGLSDQDYMQAGILCEIIFLVFALAGRLMNNNLGVLGGLFALSGLVLMGRGYGGRWAW
jgi:hypothetical protein